MERDRLAANLGTEGNAQLSDSVNKDKKPAVSKGGQTFDFGKELAKMGVHYPGVNDPRPKGR